MTLIAVSIAVHEPDDVGMSLGRAAQAVSAGARLIEWRIDSLAEHHEPLGALQRLVRESAAPCIVTCRSAFEGGDFHGADIDRAQLLLALVRSDSPPRYIDVELAAMQRDPACWQPVRDAIGELQQRRDLSTSLIVSSHDFSGRPPDLLQRIEQMTHDDLCSVVKIAWHARSLRDNLQAFDLLRDRLKPTIALCLGPFGILSRVLSPKFGGFLTFATDHEAQVTGPGQPTIEDLTRQFRFDQISAETRVYGVIGWPVSHSRSPAIHNAGFQAIGHDGVYLPLPVPPEYEHFKATVGAMIDHQGLNFRGASVTLPHKEHLLRFVQERGGRCDPLSERIGAANTLVVGSAGGLECINTDAPGAIETLCAGMNINRDALRQHRVAVIGAGGMARAVVAGLMDSGTETVIFNRSPERAARMLDDLQQRAGCPHPDDWQATVAQWDQLSSQRFDVYINCTPVGMEGGPAGGESPLPYNFTLDETMTVFDTVYTPPRTPLIAEAQARGARTISGLELFVRQAALQFERWTGVPAPIETFKGVLTRQ